MTVADSPQGLWFANPGGSNSIPSRTHSSVQRTRSLPVHTTPQTMVMFQQSGKKRPPRPRSHLRKTWVFYRQWGVLIIDTHVHVPSELLRLSGRL